MKTIEQYVNEIYKDFDADEKEVNELKIEMSMHLRDSVNELLNEGFSPEKALDEAIKRFGEPKSLMMQLNELYRVRRVNKTIAKGLLFFSILVGLLGISCIVSFFAWNYKFADQVIDKVKEEIISVAKTNDSKSKVHGAPVDMKQKITDIVDNRASIQAIGIEISVLGDTTSEPFDFSYPVSKQVEQRAFTYVMGAETGEQVGDKLINISIRQWRLDTTFFMSGICLLFGYWISFNVWSILNMNYNKGKNKVVWTLVIVIFNVLGYWLYKELNQRKHLGVL